MQENIILARARARTAERVPGSHLVVMGEIQQGVIAAARLGLLSEVEAYEMFRAVSYPVVLEKLSQSLFLPGATIASGISIGAVSAKLNKK